MKPINLYYLFLCSIFLYSCEYTNDGEYFKEIEKPLPTREFAVDISQQVGNTIYVFRDIELSINIETLGLGVNTQNLILTLDGRPQNISYNYDGTQCYTYIYINELTEGTHVLKLYFETLNTGSGSLADVTGGEYYTSEVAWDLYYMKLEYTGVDLLPLQAGPNEDGFLQLSWDKLDIPLLKGYYLSWYDNYNERSIILDKNTTTFVDENFVGGSREYAIYAIVEGYNDQPYDYYARYIKYRGSIRIDEPISMQIERTDVTQLTISWNSTKYKARYTFKSYGDYGGQSTILSDSEETAVVVNRGNNYYQNFELYVYPYNSTFDGGNNSLIITGSHYWW